MKYSSPFFAFSFASLACSLPPLAPPAAGHITSIEELSAYFSSVFGSDPHTVLLFLQAKVGLLRRTLPLKQVDVGDLNDFTACTECLDVRLRLVRSHMHLCCRPL